MNSPLDDPAAEVVKIISSLKASLRAMFPDEEVPLAISRGNSTQSPGLSPGLTGGSAGGWKAPSTLTLEEIRDELGECTRCPLHKSRTSIVFGAGNPEARLMFIGEGPGEEEDKQGEPFVGKAGQLLTRMINAIALERSEVYITNIVKCRPPLNRNPLPLEIETCNPFLLKQIESIRPKIICALGKFAAQTLLKTDAAISALRGRFHDFRGIPVMPTFHPAYLLRNPQSKRQAWEDLQAIQGEYGKVG